MANGLDSQSVMAGFADQVIYNLKKELMIHSPSKRTEPIGEDTGLGYAKGVYNSIPDVIAAGSTLSDAMLTSLATSAVAAGGMVSNAISEEQSHGGSIMSGGIMSMRPSWDVAAGTTSSGEQYTISDMIRMSPILNQSGANFRTINSMINGEITATGAAKRYIDTWVRPSIETAPEAFSGAARQAQADRVGYHPSSYQVTNNVYTQNVDQQTMNKITETTSTNMAMESGV
jgi:hypothetical protein